MDASGFLSSVEMTVVGLVHEYRRLSRAANCHSEPRARNREASMHYLRVAVSLTARKGSSPESSTRREEDHALRRNS